MNCGWVIATWFCFGYSRWRGAFAGFKLNASFPLCVCCQSKHTAGKRNKLRTSPAANDPRAQTWNSNGGEKKQTFDMVDGIAVNSQIQHGPKGSLTIKHFWQVSATWKELSLWKPIKVTRHCCRQTNDLCLFLNKTFLLLFFWNNDHKLAALHFLFTHLGKKTQIKKQNAAATPRTTALSGESRRSRDWRQCSKKCLTTKTLKLSREGGWMYNACPCVPNPRRRNHFIQVLETAFRALQATKTLH